MFTIIKGMQPPYIPSGYAPGLNKFTLLQVKQYFSIFKNTQFVVKKCMIKIYMTKYTIVDKFQISLNILLKFNSVPKICKIL